MKWDYQYQIKSLQFYHFNITNNTIIIVIIAMTYDDLNEAHVDYNFDIYY